MTKTQPQLARTASDPNGFPDPDSLSFVHIVRKRDRWSSDDNNNAKNAFGDPRQWKPIPRWYLVVGHKAVAAVDETKRALIKSLSQSE